MSHQPELARRWAELYGATPVTTILDQPVYCQECQDDGRVQIVRRRLGAWMCPIHRDLCHITTTMRGACNVTIGRASDAVIRNELRERTTRDGRSAEEIAPPIPTPETDAAPPDGSGIKVIMLAGAIK